MEGKGREEERSLGMGWSEERRKKKEGGLNGGRRREEKRSWGRE